MRDMEHITPDGPSGAHPPEAGASAPFAREGHRKLAHMAPGLIPFALWLLPHDDPLPWWNLAIVVTAVGLLILIWGTFLSALRRSRHENWIQTCLTYGLPPLTILLLFPGHAEYASTVITVLAFGDTAASVGGRKLGRTVLPWHTGKTWTGFLSFIIVATPIATLAFWGEAHPRVPWTVAATYGGLAALIGALAESCPWRLDDNLRVSIGALIGLLIAALVVPTPT